MDTKHTTGPWQVRYTEVHGRRYGLRDVALLAPDALLCIEGSGGAHCFRRDDLVECDLPAANERLGNFGTEEDLFDLMKALREEN